MVLVDTSVWVEAARRRPPTAEQLARRTEARRLPDLLATGVVVAHVWVLAELVIGGLPPDTSRSYERLPRARPVPMSALLTMLRDERPVGLGLTDAQLLATAVRDRLRLWTLDAALREEARRRGVAWTPT